MHKGTTLPTNNYYNMLFGIITTTGNNNESNITMNTTRLGQPTVVNLLTLQLIV